MSGGRVRVHGHDKSCESSDKTLPLLFSSPISKVAIEVRDNDDNV